MKWVDSELICCVVNLWLRADGWRDRWVVSDWKRSEGKAGTFKHTAGKWSGDADDKGNLLLCM